MSSDVARRAPPARLVLFHGLASTPKEFGFLIHPLRREGIRLEAPEVPGYSATALAERARWQDWVAQARAVLARLGEASPEPYVLGGLCTGAMLALAVATADGAPLPGLRGLALLSPLFAYDGWGLPRWYGLRRLAYALGLVRRFHMAERPPYGLKNERMRRWVRAQIAASEAAGQGAGAPAGETSLVGPARVSLQVVRESERLSAHVLPRLPGLAVPVLAQHARDDEICSLASARAALRAIPPRLLSLQVLEDSYHMITADNDRHLVADRLSAFVQGLDACAAHTVAFARDLASEFDVAEAASS
jgi:carboxylesterase